MTAKISPAPMFRLTKEETRLVIFVLCVFALGLAVKHYRDQYRAKRKTEPPVLAGSRTP